MHIVLPFSLYEQAQHLPTVYHVTPTRNLNSILEKGIEPRIGPRSRRLGEKIPGIYCFPTIDDIEDALDNWLFYEFSESTLFALIRIWIPGNVRSSQEVEWEIILHGAVPSSNIKVLSRDLGNEKCLDRFR